MVKDVDGSQGEGEGCPERHICTYRTEEESVAV